MTASHRGLRGGGTFGPLSPFEQGGDSVWRSQRDFPFGFRARFLRFLPSCWGRNCT